MLRGDAQFVRDARQYIESFDVYGDKATFEWTRIEHEPCVVHHGEKPERVTIPDFAHLLPEGIRRYTTKGVYDADEAQHLSFTQGSGHGGSHPHMAHEFISAIVEGRPPRPDAGTSANWTMTGICAHQSAMKGGAGAWRSRRPDQSAASAGVDRAHVVAHRRGQAVPCEFCRDG